MKETKNCPKAFLQTFTTTAFFAVTAAFSLSAQTLKTTYDAPAADWESQALPLGNGYMAIMVFGGVQHDVIQMNEHSVWSGGPGKNANYNGGHSNTADNRKQNLQNARNALQTKTTAFTASNNPANPGDYAAEDAALRGYIEGIMGDHSDFGSYQSLSNINIAHPSAMLPEIYNISGDCDNTDNPSEGLQMLFDANTSTKWFADNGFKGLPCSVIWEYDMNFTLSQYKVTSANDMQARDPKDWKLYGSNNGQDYTLIDTKANITFSERNQTLTFNVSQCSYKYFKFEITALNTAGNSPQLSEIELIYANALPTPQYNGYVRELNIDSATSNITYVQDGVTYTRQYFVSYPDNAVVIRYAANQGGKLTRNIWISSPQTSITQSAADGVITMQGKPADHGNNGLKFAQQIKVIPQGGSITASGNKIQVENADEILIISSAATNYVQSMDDNFNYFSSVNPLTKVQQTINAASSKTFAQLLSAHIEDYKSLYDGMTLTFSNAASNNKTTPQLLDGYKNNTNTAGENRYLEQLYFQFGRYLLISSSRPNTLPANLQGKWAQGLNPPWAADYHTNINLQMNYWLAEQTNLAECHIPVIDYVKSLAPRGRNTAQHYYCKQDGTGVRGWVIHHENNIWGNTAPGNYYDGFHFPTAAGWMCQDIWEYYQFNKDRSFLEEYYPVLLEAALFWVDNLWTDSRDNKLVANPSFSPEHGRYSLGASCDQAIIAELFDMVLKASAILYENAQNMPPEVNEIQTAKEKLSGPKIGVNGQFMEWKDELRMDVTGDNGHRHTNHLHYLHPGSQVVAGRSAQDDKYVEAMKKTLNTRGDGGTGWSKAWKINFWARLHDGNRSHKLLQEILKESTLSNLFDTHPPFQIDGNFGSTAGMTEMLLQSQGDCIELFPALPAAWNNGTFKGVKARGNFELQASWSNGNMTSVEILSNAGTECVLKYNGISGYYVASGKNSITPTVINADKISFPTTAGLKYRIQDTPIPITGAKKTTGKYGIIVDKNPVIGNAAKISVKTPQQAQINLAIYDAAGNVVFEKSKEREDKEILWNLTNTVGRFVANGSYLVIAEAKDKNGKVYTYSAKLGVKR